LYAYKDTSAGDSHLNYLETSSKSSYGPKEFESTRMLPTEPPTVSPVDMEVDGTYPSDEEEDGPIIQLSSIEINMLIHQVS